LVHKVFSCRFPFHGHAIGISPDHIIWLFGVFPRSAEGCIASVERGMLIFFRQQYFFLLSTFGEAVNPIQESFNGFFLIS
jgi:hypothetical protein